MRVLHLPLIVASLLALSACGPDLNSPYSDPGTPDRKAPRSGLSFELRDGVPATTPYLSGLPENESDGGLSREFSTGDEASIVSTMPRRPAERFIRGPGHSQRRAILI